MSVVATNPDTSNRADTAAARETIVVDMDRTLLAVDMTLESVLGLAGRKPWKIPAMIGWALAGRAVLKARLAREAIPDVDLAPANPEVIDFLRQKKAEGAFIVLASASNEDVVKAVAANFSFFDATHGSNSENNFKGADKADFLDSTYGQGAYTYLGDSPSDLKVWERGGKAVTVGAPKAVQEEAAKRASAHEHINVASRDRKAYIRQLVKTLRPHQWSKNVLIFVPLLAAQEINAGTITAALLAFVAFSLTASSVYVLNDMVDLDADRAHPRKKKRPFASGIVPVKDGFVLGPLLLLAAFAIAVFLLPPLFVLVLAGYYALTTSYSFFLKKKIMVDTFTLAGLYTIRIIAGGAATAIPMSPWLIGFSIFFFLALAIAKRLGELVAVIQKDTGRASKRDYSAVDLGMVQSLGAAAGYASVLVLIFYFNSPEASSLYERPEVLWGVSPLILFWISRLLVIANRGHMDDDPIVFAAKDRTSMAVGALCLAIVLVAEFL
jgi:4-hydroxybenzoate polyprenyltransferase/phosphoserine phosphatase